jgi:hypothetical protein
MVLDPREKGNEEWWRYMYIVGICQVFIPAVSIFLELQLLDM